MSSFSLLAKRNCWHCLQCFRISFMPFRFICCLQLKQHQVVQLIKILTYHFVAWPGQGYKNTCCHAVWQVNTVSDKPALSYLPNFLNSKQELLRQDISNISQVLQWVHSGIVKAVAVSAEQRRVLSCLYASVCVFRETLSGDCDDRNKALSAVLVLLRPVSLTGTITAIETQFNSTTDRWNSLTYHFYDKYKLLCGTFLMKNIVSFFNLKCSWGARQGMFFAQSDRWEELSHVSPQESSHRNMF